MMRLVLTICAGFAAWPCLSETVVPTRTIRAAALISENDVTLTGNTSPNGFTRLQDVIGQEARVVLYAGRPIMVDQIGPPAIVDRNQIVGLIFSGRGLQIVTDARALERGGVGDVIRVMNLSSRAVLSGQVQADGSVQIY